ncbi:hypothetical protein BOX15_Mlig011756g1 [Macrostomum lignano]|uniref:PH domain-containing protein n=1 Tax=Macrostomum lignano TaxID=282301 RepID=A0A267FNM5_9PLAT|nr:hypothetical protein BOX15_Mlig011756g1 [Macrostomum lignano]
MAHGGATSQCFQIMKAGWLLRQSDILHRWKKCWTVIYANGDLKYFESPDKLIAEETLSIPVEVQGTMRGEACRVSPPDGRPYAAVFALSTPDKTWRFCADDPDDADAWLLTLEEARQARPASAPLPQQYHQYRQYQQPPPPPPYSQYGYGPQPANQGQYQSQRVIYVENGCNVPAKVIYHPDGNTVVVYEDGRPPFCHRHSCYGCRSCCAGDAALGFAAGALLFSPFLWWPMWC